MGSRESKEGMPKWFVVVAIVVFLIGAWILALATFQGSANRRHRAVIARMKADGIPTSFEELRGDPVPDEQCAATWLMKAADRHKKIYNRYPELGKSETYLNGRPTMEEIRQLQVFYREHPEILELIRKGIACPRWAWLIDYQVITQPASSFPPGGRVFKSIDLFLGKNTVMRTLIDDYPKILLLEGNQEEAFQCQIDAFKLMNRIGGERKVDHLYPCFGQVIKATRRSKEILEAGPISPGKLEAMEAELAQMDLLDWYVAVLEFEQVLPLESNRLHQPLKGYKRWVPFFNVNRINHNISRAEEVEAIRRRVQFDPLVKIEVQHPKYPKCYKGKKRLIPYIYKNCCDSTREARALRVLVALLRRADQTLAPEADLSDLGLPSKATLDPYTGKPFQVSRDAESGFWEIEADGWVLGEVPK